MSPVPRAPEEVDRICCAVALRGGARQTFDEFRGRFAGGSESGIGEPGLFVVVEGVGVAFDSSSTMMSSFGAFSPSRIFQGVFSSSLTRVIMAIPGVPAYRVRRGIERTHEPQTNDS